MTKTIAMILLALSVWVLGELTATYIKRDEVCKDPTKLLLPTSRIVCQK